MAFRFVHTADVHLDSALRSLALRNPELGELIGNATRRAFVNIVDLCLAEQVDALLLAGDLYDGDQTSMKTARFLSEQIRRLDQAGVRVFIIRGNHDALSKITRELAYPESVKVYGGRPEAISLESGDRATPVVIHGLSFAQAQCPESLVGKYKPRVEGAVNIGLLHTSLAGTRGHDPYAPCNVSDLEATEFDYWALGHIHKRSISTGRCTIVMPGMPQGRDINESGPKSVSLVTIADDRTVHVEERFTSIAQFERVVIDLDGVADWRQTVTTVAATLEAAREATNSEHLVVRLSFTGRTPLAWQLRNDADLIKAEAEHRASVIGRTWIEKVEIQCTDLVSADRSNGDPLVELRELVGSEIIGSEAYHAALIDIGEELRGHLPPESRGTFGADQEEFRATLRLLAQEGVEDVLARLHRRKQDEVA
ncbi:MAG: DNA repair exonuclease [Mesorhizobium sp.]|uniref:metallophosphoesterase family protein n=1 Tax=unclassified Mesorhizobium TaxID=325217 RepID=UPI000FC9A812|nr:MULTISPECIES: DNA repair exonuclease [unclassified Mesorhizobium]RUV67732.1 DNA repair exonuclease [Mesorhizobium sp. M5C.F.Cr.IN.023.01.1.1]RWF88372.1 MAG: DNA repair exonuclease [Mesorhizobium sp.]RWF89450.1 MAG: DNA repair exonuclease [Mesorhizobium sp.]RWJ06557.1 MAG: DNA repair exonuclease [Mesorhizobium sp.]RWJ11865.1 MAG: DNA repair exonuclease [Mesorhizobium sp.]